MRPGTIATRCAAKSAARSPKRAAKRAGRGSANVWKSAAKCGARSATRGAKLGTRAGTGGKVRPDGADRGEHAVNVLARAAVVHDARAEHEAGVQFRARDERLAADLQPLDQPSIQRLV